MLTLESIYLLAGLSMIYVDDEELDLLVVDAGDLTSPAVDVLAVAGNTLPHPHMLIDELVESVKEIVNIVSA